MTSDHIWYLFGTLLHSFPVITVTFDITSKTFHAIHGTTLGLQG